MVAGTILRAESRGFASEEEVEAVFNLHQDAASSAS
jgi:hypothetical protein